MLLELIPLMFSRVLKLKQPILTTCILGGYNYFDTYENLQNIDIINEFKEMLILRNTIVWISYKLRYFENISWLMITSNTLQLKFEGHFDDNFSSGVFEE